jgi:hypothetical protein
VASLFCWWSSRPILASSTVSGRDPSFARKGATLDLFNESARSISACGRYLLWLGDVSLLMCPAVISTLQQRNDTG